MDWSKLPAVRPPLEPGAVLERRFLGAHSTFGRTDLSGDRDGYVYLVRFLAFVKLGFSADPARRIAAIAANLPGELELLWVARGRLSDEQRLHAALSPHRVKGEWYRLDAVADFRKAVA